jgi:peptidase M23-like protein
MREAIAVTLGVLLGATVASAERIPDGGGPARAGQAQPCLTDEQRQAIKAEIQRSTAELRTAGLLPFVDVAQVGLAWPVRGATPMGDPGVHGISNFVDQNGAYPNAVLDYDCGGRTYDLASGYNHRGTDMFTWPYPWLRMDRSEVHIVAGAPGTIVYKSDGNPDRTCSGSAATNWNAVYVEHADGSTAWYGHMKNGSPTAKTVGQTVATGEYLGVVGSSGNSTGPHLHFELYDPADALIDPYFGPCNTLNLTTWWTAQRPYRDSAINKLATHSAPPVFPACPQAETPNLTNNFAPGVVAYFAAYYRDHVAGQQTQYSIQTPDGFDWRTWNSTAMTTYDAAYWYYWWTLPASPPLGRWNFRAVYQGTTYNHGFNVLSPSDVIFQDGFQIGL